MILSLRSRHLVSDYFVSLLPAVTWSPLLQFGSGWEEEGDPGYWRFPDPPSQARPPLPVLGPAAISAWDPGYPGGLGVSLGSSQHQAEAERLLQVGCWTLGNEPNRHCIF